VQSRLVHQEGGQRTFVVVLETGDEVMGSLKEFVAREGLMAAQFTAIGAFERARLAYFDWGSKSYQDIPVEEQVEVASLLGDVARGEKDQPKLHIHLVLGRRDGSAIAGHLVEGHVRPTLEVVVTEAPAHLRRCHDPETGLALIDLDA
jgi:predicted DNA-binding protein with PD1-like motif